MAKATVNNALSQKKSSQKTATTKGKATNSAPHKRLGPFFSFYCFWCASSFFSDDHVVDSLKAKLARPSCATLS
jgi:hypothetical protein